MEINVKVRSIANDGLPDMEQLTGRVAFIWDGCIVSGWPVLSKDATGNVWEASDDALGHGVLVGVTHWLEFPFGTYTMESGHAN